MSDCPLHTLDKKKRALIEYREYQSGSRVEDALQMEATLQRVSLEQVYFFLGLVSLLNHVVQLLRSHAKWTPSELMNSLWTLNLQQVTHLAQGISLPSWKECFLEHVVVALDALSSSRRGLFWLHLGLASFKLWNTHGIAFDPAHKFIARLECKQTEQRELDAQLQVQRCLQSVMHADPDVPSPMTQEHTLRLSALQKEMEKDRSNAPMRMTSDKAALALKDVYRELEQLGKSVIAPLTRVVAEVSSKRSSSDGCFIPLALASNLGSPRTNVARVHVGLC